jgi:Outer membrane protein/protective antigen OMA87
MLLARQVTLFTYTRWITCSVLALALIASCTVPRKVQPGKPFVFKTTIKVEGNVPDKPQLEERLKNQLDDSLKTRVISYAGVRRVIDNPPVFDTANISRSKVFINSLLYSLGYFYPEVTEEVRIDTVRRKKEDQYRTYIHFTVKPGKVIRLDSIGYQMATPELQELALSNRDKSPLKKGEPYTLQSISEELDRLTVIFRNAGYYKMNKENLEAEVDTVVAALIDPTLDPFEQIRLLDSLRRKRENPTINVMIRQKPVEDGNQVKKFYIGDVTVYPDTEYGEDSTAAGRDTVMVKGYRFIRNTNKFKLPFVARNIRLVPGSQYVQRRYFRTINNFTSLGAWQNVDINLRERYDSVPLLDAFIHLYPAPKQNLNVSFETSRNVSDYLTTGQLFGVGLNGRLLNRNAYREAIQTITSARAGIELGRNFIQTLQLSLAHTINFPHFITPIRINTDSLIAPRTLLNLNAAYTDRLDLFTMRSFNASWGYEWTKGRRRDDQDPAGQRWRKTWQYIPLNFELTDVTKTDSLEYLENIISSYRYAFNNGLIISQILSMTTGYDKGRHRTQLRGRVEESGALFGLIKSLELGDLRRFVKVDGEIKHFITNKKSQWAFRAYGGYGYIYGKTDTDPGPEQNITNENTLPFFKAFVAGGPYSMRAWQIRRLGPGSSTLYNPGDTVAIERFGNMQLELNAEYRFNVTTIAGIKVNSAFFVDIGNIWSKEIGPDNKPIPEASFHIDRFFKDLAIGAGTSLRFDFDFFLIRLDWAYKLKDPLYANIINGWMQKLNVFDGQFQLGIGHPF